MTEEPLQPRQQPANFRPLSRLTDLLRRMDPNPDPQAEPVGPWPVIALFAATLVSSYFWMRWKIQPMQDLGHHLAGAAVSSDWGRDGSMYTALYLPIDRLAANSLLYTLAGWLGRLTGVTLAVRLCMLGYVALMPWAVAWMLRSRGRSLWPAVAVAGLVHYGIFAAGFGNFLFAQPFLVLAVAAYAKLLDAPSLRRVWPSALLFPLVFLAHAHVFLWLGALCLALLARALLRRPIEPRHGSRLLILLTSGAAAAPALSLFGRWYLRTIVKPPDVQVPLSGPGHGLGAVFKTPAELIRDLPDALQSLKSGQDLALLGLLLLLAAFAMGANRLRRPRERTLELCALLTLAAYFALPEWLRGTDNIASRQPMMALWFLPALLDPLPASISRTARWVVTAGLGLWTAAFLTLWGTTLWRFEREEAAGLAEVLEAVPPRVHVHMVKLDSDSRFYTWHTFWHVEKFPMSDRLGHTPDTIGILASSPVHYRPGVQLPRVTDHSADWAENDDIRKHFGAVLLRRWNPTPVQRERAAARFRLLRKAGDWEVWAPLK